MSKKNSVFSAKCLSTLILIASASPVFAQDNSPYSRYGLGDMVPNTNIVNRGMGGVSAAYTDAFSVNFNNPASYSGFQALKEEKSHKLTWGRVLLNAGVNFDNKTLRNPNQPQKFSSPNLYFSYLQLGIPLRKNWGMSLGLRPMTRINYKIESMGVKTDPLTGKVIDSATTQNTGSGGSFLPSIGTGFAIKKFSIGANMGYLFGKKEYGTQLFLMNDTVSYNNTNYTTNSSFGGIYFDAGVQYKIDFGKNTNLNLGVSGNWKQKLDAERDVTRITFDPNTGSPDTIFQQLGSKSEIVYPASYTAGFVLEHRGVKGNSWMLGADLVQTQWNDYRFFGEKDSVKDNWQLRTGVNFRPESGRNYFSNVIYRAGFFLGPDYVQLGKELPQFGASFGLALPIAPSRMNPSQFTIINLALEYSQRGNNENSLKENLFRISLGLNFSDLWFSKRKYD